MRTLGIDFGARRIGLALSDTGGNLATPHTVLAVTDPHQAISPILKLIEQEAVERLVVGLPLNMDATPGAAAKSTVAWSRQLAAAVKKAKLKAELVFVDERLSSFAAEQQFIDRKRSGEKITRKNKKKRLDAQAAAGFLQAYLDGKLPAIDVPGPA